jgi:predicted outer membrane protein
MYKSTIRVAGLCLIAAASATGIVYSSDTYACDGLANSAPCNAGAATLVPVANLAQLTDGEIAYIYLQANLFDVEGAELGVARGTASGVKQHGEMVAKDHRSVVVAFQGILTQNNIKPVPPPTTAPRSSTIWRS